MKTLKKEKVKINYVDKIPTVNEMEQNVMYICQKNNYSAHLCFGCFNTPVIMPMDIPNGWKFNINNDKLTVEGSFLNRACNCHYIIINGIANIV